ncbi:MAG: hypothetical protein JO322_07035 [Candidatus Eremiobacteraeota bacterium]|nr:hypothetical protein [Candidatus Eremiobacteraeota bacterium]
MTSYLTRLLREPKTTAAQQCELCAAPVGGAHGHVVDTSDRRLLCTCTACSMLFTGSTRGRLRAVPKRYAIVPSPLFSDAQWDALGIPIGLAFFFENSKTQRVVAFYPGPAGATESELPLEAWSELRAREPQIALMQPDVEAVLVYRLHGYRARAFLVPIDVCYELVGLVRSQWTGISGGDEVHETIDRFFERISEYAR